MKPSDRLHRLEFESPFPLRNTSVLAFTLHNIFKWGWFVVSEPWVYTWTPSSVGETEIDISYWKPKPALDKNCDLRHRPIDLTASVLGQNRINWSYSGFVVVSDIGYYLLVYLCGRLARLLNQNGRWNSPSSFLTGKGGGKLFRCLFFGMFYKVILDFVQGLGLVLVLKQQMFTCTWFMRDPDFGRTGNPVEWMNEGDSFRLWNSKKTGKTKPLRTPINMIIMTTRYLSV